MYNMPYLYNLGPSVLDNILEYSMYDLWTIIANNSAVIVTKMVFRVHCVAIHFGKSYSSSPASVSSSKEKKSVTVITDTNSLHDTSFLNDYVKINYICMICQTKSTKYNNQKNSYSKTQFAVSTLYPISRAFSARVLYFSLFLIMWSSSPRASTCFSFWWDSSSCSW